MAVRATEMEAKKSGAAGMNGGEKAKAVKKGRRIDRSAGLGRTGFVCVLYCLAFGYAYMNAPLGDGTLKYDKDPVKAFMVSPAMVYGAPLGYVLAVLLFSRFMADKKPVTNFLRNFVQPVYNVTQIVVCAYMVIGLWPQVLVFEGNPFGLNTERNASIEYFVYIHYLTKFLDWCDTFFMILKKNYEQVSFLQVFHHATIGMVWGFLLSRGWGSGTAAYGAFINSVTHVIMYTHYLWTSFGLNNPFKRFITSFQISQFASCIVHAVLVLIFEKVYPMELAYLQVAYHTIMIFLFGWQLNWAPFWLVGGIQETPAALKQKKTI